ncbi:MAG: glycine cleavage system protein H [Candidatus Edwardsbacteria bacterium RIFOXYD12_FULL_50_11]|jgi:glycine cleavage system H protein|uniref:Glycine cleavage system H protein n=1 Tax=Candidatus Edwardsbacteria bacterium GWF2_54_11 TaxID=1817851 RepID=A0A1F5RHN1_9BACT|nr:MAG: glycine cleavage system protein H [Candidatus Edwardsbacteria bacterium RifOxyC12_full_54_24]OGF06113.1 MAG: glycine cleavage system protein H [Candidatus Edwardsbacteria bacterium RifOxyA12_full_54_48]OGF12620.1 MAG: glycine cleavage system protein H [Candidatus Edwardsbacteria bacterium GWE2_54_12]OGF13844.1 MAG: glycine cleavage system protein H [Candidatus Edwardsbacteria bacterium GWF2_54_11]OGF17829.1 MAG: glycine cleavage system protein H [Candidatus Edwardsbacteria bacterium RIF
MNFPKDLKYTASHEWARIEGDTATIGITDFAQGELGDIVFVEMPAVGSKVEMAKPFGTVEAVKAVSDLNAPLSGEVAAINGDLEGTPDLVNKDAYGKGWMVKIKLSDISQAGKLMDAEAYEKMEKHGH